jgi:anthranilate phosphoribosyltransferase
VSHPSTWPSVLSHLLAGVDLSHDEASWAMTEILSGNATPSQIGGFAMALRAKGESAAEVAAFVDVMLAHALVVQRPHGPEVVLDVVGTGGDQSGSVNISTMAALVCASMGAPIVKHGNRAASSQTGTADVLEELGVSIDLSPEDVARCVHEVGFGFCFAPNHHPSLRYAGPTRRELGVPTVFNILGPLTNPGLATTALVGCANPVLAPVMADVLHRRGVSAVVVRSDDGLDEISTGAITTAWDATGAQVEVVRIDPPALGVALVDRQLLRGGDRERNAVLLRLALGGKDVAGPDADAVKAIREVVALNAATAMAAFQAVGQTAVTPLLERIALHLPATRDAVVSGQAMELLERWAQLTQTLHG